MEYVGKQHADHLATIFKKTIISQKTGKGRRYAGIDLKWDYEKRTCRATMDGYILDLRNKFQHMKPKKPNCHHINISPLIMEPHDWPRR